MEKNIKPEKSKAKNVQTAPVKKPKGTKASKLRLYQMQTEVRWAPTGQQTSTGASKAAERRSGDYLNLTKERQIQRPVERGEKSLFM